MAQPDRTRDQLEHPHPSNDVESRCAQRPRSLHLPCQVGRRHPRAIGHARPGSASSATGAGRSWIATIDSSVNAKSHAWHLPLRAGTHRRRDQAGGSWRGAMRRRDATARSRTRHSDGVGRHLRRVARAGAMPDTWASRFLAVQSRLIYCPVLTCRGPSIPSTHHDQERVSFADGFPLLVAGQASLDDVNRRLEAKGVAPVPMNRFRPNLVIAGSEPFAEDTWRRIRIGRGAAAVEIDIVKPCARCSTVPVDQSTGIRAERSLSPPSRVTGSETARSISARMQSIRPQGSFTSAHPVEIVATH